MNSFYGDNTRWFIGVVEDNMNDPLKLGRVRVRAFGVHSPFIDQVPTDDLPWATIMVSATEGGISGIGRSPNGIQQGAWVFGLFLEKMDHLDAGFSLSLIFLYLYVRYF